jgi:endonuclease/exonuclease/phosphatase family metal-dependent hydrolase
MERAAERVMTLRPDIVLLQEVWYGSDLHRITERLASDYEAVDPAPGPLGGGSGGLLSLVRRPTRGDEWTVAEPRGHTFTPFEHSASPWKFWQGDGLGRKGAQCIFLERLGRRVLVINTHLQASYRGYDYYEIRKLQFDQLRRLASLPLVKIPVLVGGDLNMKPPELGDSLAYWGTDWQDLAEGWRKSCDCGTEAGGLDSARRWKDYVLAQRSDAWRFRARSIARIESLLPDEPYSDHHGLDLTIELERVNRSALTSSMLLVGYLSVPRTRREWLASVTWLAATLLSSLPNAFSIED